MKNQERVWKAEQAVAEEKKRMMELQRERAEERDRAELNSLIKHSSNSPANDIRLSWMYDVGNTLFNLLINLNCLIRILNYVYTIVSGYIVIYF